MVVGSNFNLGPVRVLRSYIHSTTNKRVAEYFCVEASSTRGSKSGSEQPGDTKWFNLSDIKEQVSPSTKESLALLRTQLKLYSSSSDLTLAPKPRDVDVHMPLFECPPNPTAVARRAEAFTNCPLGHLLSIPVQFGISSVGKTAVFHYWAFIDYRHIKNVSVEWQPLHEDTPNKFVQQLCSIFEQSTLSIVDDVESHISYVHQVVEHVILADEQDSL
jgi:hypothetical protein